MTTLVTGGAGYIGSHMVLALLDAGEQVVVIDDLSTGFRSSVDERSVFFEGDVGDKLLLNSLFSQFKFDDIIHFAGSVVVPDSVREPLRYYENNTSKSLALISAAVEAKVPRFVFSSTAAVYGSPSTSAPLRETDRLAPESPYGYSKLMTEIMLEQAARAHNFHYTALRYFNVAGADVAGRAGQSTAGATHLVKVACEAALGKRQFVDLYGDDYQTADGTCVRDFIHVSDLANAHLLAVQRMRNGGRSLVANCGYGQGFSVKEILKRIQQLANREFTINIKDRRPGDSVSVVANSEVARRELNWSPKFQDLDTILQTALNWEAR